MSTAAALSELLLSAFRSSDESISPLPSASASSNTALREKISFLLYFLDILDNAPDILAATLVRRGTWVRAACVTGADTESGVLVRWKLRGKFTTASRD